MENEIIKRFRDLVYNGVEPVYTEKGIATKGVSRRIKENLSMDEIEQFILSELKALKEEIESLRQNKNFGEDCDDGLQEMYENDCQVYNNCLDAVLKVFAKRGV